MLQRGSVLPLWIIITILKTFGDGQMNFLLSLSHGGWRSLKERESRAGMGSVLMQHEQDTHDLLPRRTLSDKHIAFRLSGAQGG